MIRWTAAARSYVSYQCFGPCTLVRYVGSDGPIPRYIWRRSAGQELLDSATWLGCFWLCKHPQALAGSEVMSHQLMTENQQGRHWRFLWNQSTHVRNEHTSLAHLLKIWTHKIVILRPFVRSMNTPDTSFLCVPCTYNYLLKKYCHNLI